MHSIFQQIMNYRPKIEGIDNKACVMIGLFQQEGEMQILFTKRAFTLKTQPGDICFPGGKVEDGECELDALYREVYEELHILQESMEVIGQLDYVVTTYGMLVIPYVVYMKDVSTINFNKDEVEEVIYIPLKELINKKPEEYEIIFQQIFPKKFPFDKIQNGKEYKWRKATQKQYFYYYQGNTIWGLTGRILYNFIDVIRECSYDN